jgi:SP family myo-inositol transporter-like MFS transporter 13
LENISKVSIEQIEHVEPLDYVKDQSDLSSIEATDASKTASRIPIVVSISGLLFGMLSMQL